MPLVSLNEILDTAKRNKEAIPAFNVVNCEMIIAAIRASEKEQSPIIIEYTEGDDKRLSIEIIGRFASNLAKKSSVPICVHFDHGVTKEGIKRAIDNGFSSVMIDASNNNLEDNIKITKSVVDYCKPLGISVEAELGRIQHGKQNYTDIEQVKEFVERTNIDALAISFGTEHGVYKQKPDINYELVRKVSEITEVPLVMHGGSGLSEEVYHNVINSGVAKINYYSAMSNKVLNKILITLSENFEPNNLYLQDFVDLELKLFEDEMKKVIKLFKNKK